MTPAAGNLGTPRPRRQRHLHLFRRRQRRAVSRRRRHQGRYLHRHIARRHHQAGVVHHPRHQRRRRHRHADRARRDRGRHQSDPLRDRNRLDHRRRPGRGRIPADAARPAAAISARSSSAATAPTSTPCSTAPCSISAPATPRSTPSRLTALDGTTKQVAFTIHGTNDAAVIGTPTVHDVTEDADPTALTASGTISISDADQNQSSFQTSVTAAAGTLGALSTSRPTAPTPTRSPTPRCSISAPARPRSKRSRSPPSTAPRSRCPSPSTAPTTPPSSARRPCTTSTKNPRQDHADRHRVDLDHGRRPGPGRVQDHGGIGRGQSRASDARRRRQPTPIPSPKRATQYSAPAASKVDTFTVTSLDGTTEAGHLHHPRRHGANTPAMIGDPTNADVTEDVGGATLTASGSISITDPDAGQAAFQTDVAPGAGNLGTLVAADQRQLHLFGRRQRRAVPRRRRHQGRHLHRQVGRRHHRRSFPSRSMAPTTPPSSAIRSVHDVTEDSGIQPSGNLDRIRAIDGRRSRPEPVLVPAGYR